MMDTYEADERYKDISYQNFLNKILLFRVWTKSYQGQNNLKLFYIEPKEQHRSQQAANFIQKYNSQIQHMNYLTLPAYGQNTGLKAVNSLSYNLIGHQKVLLTLVSMALAADFKRYTELINAKIVHQELGRSRTRANSQQTTPQPQTISQNPPKKPQSLRNKLNEKSKPSKIVQPAKQQKPKNKSPPSQPAPKLSPQPKPTRKEVTQKVAPLKTYKKIQKEAEGKKENPGRVPRINMVSTAELSRVQLGERQKRKLRERLLIRQVKEWPVPEQGRRDRRDLRTQH